MALVTCLRQEAQIRQGRIEERYSRQTLFHGIGVEGQRRLASGRVAIVGCGATGSALAGLLARAGVGELRIIDRDYVEPSNLQRQSLFDEKDALESLPKAIAAARKIASFNSEIAVEPEVNDLTPANIEGLLEGMDLILDGTDNFETRYLLNDYAVKQSIPWIYSAAVGSYGVTMNILPAKTACLACIFPDSPRGIVETCETSGILNEPCCRLTSGPTNTGKFPRLSRVPTVVRAEPKTSFISREKGGRILRSAVATPCRFTSTRGQSISRRWIAASNPTAWSGTMTSC